MRAALSTVVRSRGDTGLFIITIKKPMLAESQGVIVEQLHVALSKVTSS